VLIALGGDCRTPLGALAERAGDEIRLRAFVAGDEAAAPRRAERRSPWPSSAIAAHDLGLALGRELR
jgi:porphobilinogen deaminase